MTFFLNGFALERLHKTVLTKFMLNKLIIEKLNTFYFCTLALIPRTILRRPRPLWERVTHRRESKFMT